MYALLKVYRNVLGHDEIEIEYIGSKEDVLVKRKELKDVFKKRSYSLRNKLIVRKIKEIKC